MLQLFADVVSKTLFLPHFFAAFFYFAATITFFNENWWSLTHKLLIFYVYEVSAILVNSGLRENRISWGGEISCFRDQYK